MSGVLDQESWITRANGDPPIEVEDALGRSIDNKFQMVLTNPPFGSKASYTIIADDGAGEPDEDLAYLRDDFWATTKNKQLNFVQHVHSILDTNGTAAVVVPDNVLFEAGAGETIRRRLKRPLRPEHLTEFITCYNADNRLKRTATERFKPFTYGELVAREKVSLDIIWLQDESLEDSENLPAPEVIDAEFVDELEAALTEFRAVAEIFGNGEPGL